MSLKPTWLNLIGLLALALAAYKLMVRAGETHESWMVLASFVVACLGLGYWVIIWRSR